MTDASEAAAKPKIFFAPPARKRSLGGLGDETRAPSPALKARGAPQVPADAQSANGSRNTRD